MNNITTTHLTSTMLDTTINVKKPMKLSGDRNQCPTCQEYFNSSKAFDSHRRGSFDPLLRHCLSPAQMEAKGMSKNAQGFWVTETMGDRASDFRQMPKWPFAKSA